MSRQTPKPLVLVLALVAACTVAADSVRDLVTTGDRLYENGDYTGALRLFVEIQTAATNDPRMQLHATARMAECQYSLGQYGNALHSYDELLTKWPHGGRRYLPDLHMGDCLLIVGRTNEALKAYNFVNKEYPTNYHVNVQSRVEEMTRKSPNQAPQGTARKFAAPER